MVILVTGKRDSGKTTWATRFAQEMVAEGFAVVVLDSDIVRSCDGDQDYTDEGREKHLEKLARRAATIEYHGALCIVAAMSPRREWRDMMRSIWKESRLIYMPGGSLWEGTSYERPVDDEY